jgi:hypothetical protein
MSEPGPSVGAGDADAAASRWRHLLRRSAAPYLSLIVVTIVLARFAQYLWPTQPFVKGQGPAIVLTFAGFGAALVIGSLYRPQGVWPAEFRWVIGAWGALWAVGVGLSLVHGDLFNITALLVPLLLLLIVLKMSSVRATLAVCDVLALSLIVIAILSQALDAAGIKVLANEGWNRWPILTEILGPIGRWQGPFGSVNYAGPAGTFILMLGLLRSGWQRPVFIVAGGVIVFLSDSRSAMLSCAVGVAALVALTPRVGSRRNPIWIRVAAPVLVAAGALAYIVLVDPTFNLRTPVWEVFLTQWTSSPLIGVGGTGIQDLIASGALPAWANHGHNLLVDPLGRFGVVGGVAVLSVLVATGVVVVKAAHRGFVAPLVLLCTFAAAGVSDALVDWRYFSIFALPLMLSAMLGAAWLVPEDPGPRIGLDNSSERPASSTT